MTDIKPDESGARWNSLRGRNDYRAPSTFFGEIGFTLTREIYPKTHGELPQLADMGERGSDRMDSQPTCRILQDLTQLPLAIPAV